ncbi:MAG TPA: methyltransferase domain-containing protein, partial [Flavisolibacter sp.]
YFRKNKKFGSRDRRIVSDLCFCYFRTGQAFSSYNTEERMLLGQFLCSRESQILLEMRPDWFENVHLPLPQKLAMIGNDTSPHIFPFPELLSDRIDASQFNLSFLQQPDVFLRIRPGRHEIVRSRLATQAMPFEIETDAVRLPPGFKTEEIFQTDAEVVVQDLNSQKVLDALAAQPLPGHTLKVWDCCAASGGKSLLAVDRFPRIELTVSDIRPSIIANLRKRFARAGISRYESFVLDVSVASLPGHRNFDIIICDAPCSGSGTWARTPEQLLFFKKEKVAAYARLQESIAVNAIRSLKKEGYFLYITCSVFAEENENVVSHISDHTGAQILASGYYEGWNTRADTLFFALFNLP